MADWHPIQTSFAMGEVSSRVAMRQDLPQYSQGTLEMVNWMPTPQGTVERAPGTRFEYDTGFDVDEGRETKARIIYFRDVNGADALLFLYPNRVPEVVAAPNVDPNGVRVNTTNQRAGQSNLLAEWNYSFEQGDLYWIIPNLPIEGAEPLPVGFDIINFFTDENQSRVQIFQNGLIHVEGGGRTNTAMFVRNNSATTTQDIDAVVVGCDGTFLTLIAENPENLPDQYIGLQIWLSSTDEHTGDLGRSEIRWAPKSQDFVGADKTPNQIALSGRVQLTRTLPAGSRLYVSIQMQLRNPATPSRDEGRMVVRWDVDSVQVIAADGRVPQEPTEVTPPDDPNDPINREEGWYQFDELDDIQFVQSPYGEPAGRLGYRNELVLVHENHWPAWVYWDVQAGAYKVESIPFDFYGPGASGSIPEPYTPEQTPTQWGIGHYPASCTAYQGRLVLGGGGANGEEIICSASGRWWDLYDIKNLYTAPPEGEDDNNPVLPTSALIFHTIFRSPIRWMAGQQDLLVGCSELEYKVQSQSGLLAPGDIDVRLQTTEGGGKVQPAGLGDSVLFASARDTKTRRLTFNRDRDSYVAPDMTLFNPFIVSKGVRRMVRVRNPHQMIIHVLYDGTLAVMHHETGDDSANVYGWSRISTRGRFIDITVVPDSNGQDVPVFLVARNVQGMRKLFLESMPGWGSDRNQWVFMDNYDYFVAPNPDDLEDPLDTNIITGMEHLAEQVVQVITDGRYRGAFKVQPDGTIRVKTSEGYRIPIEGYAVVGLSKRSTMTLLPPTVDITSTGGIGGYKRYTEIGLRLRDAYPPLINGVRPPFREANDVIGLPTPRRGVPNTQVSLDIAQDQPESPLFNVEAKQLGYDQFQTIRITEVLPLRCEVVGVYGDLTSNKL